MKAVYQKRDGWLIADKPAGVRSTPYLARLRHMFAAQKAGYAGTLDENASGILAVAFGEATKTIPFLLVQSKTYRFTIKWGQSTDTHDAAGQVIAASALRPSRAALLAALPHFTGATGQRPPVFSAVKFAGQRAHKLARAGQPPPLKPRTAQIEALRLLAHSAEASALEMRCGKGVYVRALARDLAERLGVCAHVSALRRTALGPFTLAHALPPLAEKSPEKSPLALCNRTNQSRKEPDAALLAHLLPVESALRDLPQLVLPAERAYDLCQGKRIFLFPSERQEEDGAIVLVIAAGSPAALAKAHGSVLHPKRIFNLSPNDARNDFGRAFSSQELKELKLNENPHQECKPAPG